MTNNTKLREIIGCFYIKDIFFKYEWRENPVYSTNALNFYIELYTTSHQGFEFYW